MARDGWDLPSLLTAADAGASAVERHLWLAHLLGWLRSAGPISAGPISAGPVSDDDPAESGTPWPVRRLRHLLNLLDRHPEHRERVAALLQTTLAGLDATCLLADFGFAPRQGFVSELAERLRLRWMPGTPQTSDLGELFTLLFEPTLDAGWVAAIDTPTLDRLLALCCPLAAATGRAEPSQPWQEALIESIRLLASQMRASAMAPAMRQRMDPVLRMDEPFHQLVQAAEGLNLALNQGASAEELQRQVLYLRAVVAACNEAALSVRVHLDEYGVSVDLVFQTSQMRQRADRIDLLLDCLLSETPADDMQRLVLELLRTGAERRGLRTLFTQHYALLARKVTERSAETGEHYITRNRAEYREMLRTAAGGGAVIGGTTLMKFALALLPLSVFWAGFAAGLNYATSFVIVHLLHWTVATKQPAMTAPSLAAKLEGVSSSPVALEAFVDDVAHLLRSQMAGILGNVALVVPVVLGFQGLAWWLAGAPMVSEAQAHYVLHSLHLAGPTVLYAAFTGVLLFASSLVAGWVENWFVFHRLDSAIAWNPRIRAMLGPARALRWSAWWRQNISGLAANVSLGMLLGLVPAIGSFFGLPLEVRHVTLSTGQLAAALGTLGTGLLQLPDFWWCVAAMPLVGLLNVGVSFALAYRVALVSRGIRNRDRSLIWSAIWRRWRQAPLSFFWPPAEPR